jgi:hypothetical protein
MADTSSRSSVPADRLPTVVQHDLAKKLMWAGVMAGASALAAMIARRGAEWIWVYVFDEEPPGD